MTESGNNTTYTGYAVILSCANELGMQENDESAANTASLRLYYLKNETWNNNNFVPGTTSNSRTLISTFKTDINNFDSTKFRLNVEIDPDTRAFDIYIDGSLRASVSSSEVKPGGTGFGFYSGYYAHNCTILTRLRYEDITVSMAQADFTPTTAEVRFLENGTDNEIRLPETETGISWQKYRIAQPRTIVYEGKTYYLTGNSRGLSVLNDIKANYQPDDEDNITILYYINPAEMPAPPPPEKNASADGGPWDNGEPDPVQVRAGSEIEYNITVYSPPQHVAMIMQNLTGYVEGVINADAPWLNQPFEDFVKRSEIKTAKFVDLPQRFDDTIEFSGKYTTWNGEPIVKVWDATEPDLSVNPDFDTHKVFAWLTEVSSGDPSAGYNLYIGGFGGVWLSAASKSSFLFQNFTACVSIDLEYLYASKAINMGGMFMNCSSLIALNYLNNLDTSNVMDMHSMFNTCSKFSTLDLSGFDTSNVENMGMMFNMCMQLKTLDLSNFDTSKVTDMGTTFFMCGVMAGGVTVYVGNTDTETLLTTLPSNKPARVELVSPIPLQPRLTEYVTVTDIIPDGLTITEATGIEDSPQTDAVTYEIDGQKITWSIPENMLPVDLTVKVTVNGGQTVGTIFENTAQVKYGGQSMSTNPTYHEYTATYLVTEQYFLYENGATSTKLDEDLFTAVESGDPYNVQGSTNALGGYEYYGYRRGNSGEVIEGIPPEIDEVDENITIQLYYQRGSGNYVTVTVHYVDEDGNELKQEVIESVFTGTDYYMPMYHMKSFNIDSTTYNYYDFATDNIVGSENPAGSTPIYPDGAEPTFENMQSSQHITLYFTAKQAITINYVEDGNESNILKDPYVYFGLLAESPDGPDSIELLENGKMYDFVSESIDGNIITRYYKTTYVVKEIFVVDTDGEYDEIDGIESKETGGYSRGDEFTGVPPTIPGYTYVGYKLNTSNSELLEGEPEIDGIYDDFTVIYIYEKDATNPGGNGNGGGTTITEPDPEPNPPETTTEAETTTAEDTTEPETTTEEETTTESDENDDVDDEDDDENPTEPTIESTTEEDTTETGINPTEPTNESSTEPTLPETTTESTTETTTTGNTQSGAVPQEVFDSLYEDDMDVEWLEENATPLSNGWFAVDLGDDWWEIFNENGVPLGVVYLSEGEDIEGVDIAFIELYLIPLANITAEIPAVTTEPPRDNPQTGDSIFAILGLLMLAIVGVAVLKRKIVG